MRAGWVVVEMKEGDDLQSLGVGRSFFIGANLLCSTLVRKHHIRNEEWRPPEHRISLSEVIDIHASPTGILLACSLLEPTTMSPCGSVW